MTELSEIFIVDPEGDKSENESEQAAEQPEEEIEKPEWALTEAEKRDKAQQAGDPEVIKDRREASERLKNILSQDKKK